LEVDGDEGRRETGRGDKTDTCIDVFVLVHDAGFILILPECQWIDVIREHCS